MPVNIDMYGLISSIATEEELLEFANKVRAAGGANILDALLLSKRSQSSACLIARALNFDCEVNQWKPTDNRISVDWPSGNPKWVMMPQRGDGAHSEKLTRQLSKDLKLRLVRNMTRRHPLEFVYGLLLPETIGNAARAFDAGNAFQNYAE